jgi:hypothetical protein
MREQGLNVIIGVGRNGQSRKEAEQDGWIPGKNLFEIDEAISRGTIVMNLLSDAAQSETWPAIKPHLTKRKVCYINEDARPCTHFYRPSTFLTASLPVLRTSRRSMSQPTLMLSSSPPKDLAEQCEVYSVRSRYKLLHCHLPGCNWQSEGEGGRSRRWNWKRLPL